MQKILILLLLMFGTYKSFSQDTLLPSINIACGSKMKGAPYRVSTNLKSPTTNAIPYCFKVFITVFADNDGTNVAMTPAEIEIRKAFMVAAYRPYNICFMFIGSQIINNTSLNNFNTSDDSNLNPYKYASTLNVFVHKSITGSDGALGGYAYDIPNTSGYLSIANNSGRSVLAHEMGHIFGLYHTFEPHPWDPFHGKESVERNSNNSCFDCDVDGDLVCDTQADPDQDIPGSLRSNTNATTCVYTNPTFLKDECGWDYIPLANNIMSYGERNCLTNFTPGQASRFLNVIANEPDFELRMAPDVNNIGSPFPIVNNSGNQNYYAKNLISVFGIYYATGSAQVFMHAKKTVLNHKTILSPTTGRIVIRPFTGCN
jgi:Pregnancy-associated plasma protein-A